MGVARTQIQDAFPVLDLLAVLSSLPSVFNPIVYYRLVKQLATHCLCRQRKIMPPLDFPRCPLKKIKRKNPIFMIVYVSCFFLLAADCCLLAVQTSRPNFRYVTRAEDIEEDDVCDDRIRPFYERKEPLPWGTLRLKDCHERFQDITFKANMMAAVVFGFCFMAYLSMLLGELQFYRHVRNIFDTHGSDQEGFEEYLYGMGTNMTTSKGASLMTEDDIESWVEE